MQIHTIHHHSKLRKKKRVGRGGKRGTFSGRGVKGQRARAGGKVRPEERDILKKIPKLRGYKFNVFQELPHEVRISRIQKVFKEGALISPKTLEDAGLVRRRAGRRPKVKILGAREVNKKFVFKHVTLSRALAEKFK